MQNAYLVVLSPRASLPV